jgi:hypothetical protein
MDNSRLFIITINKVKDLNAKKAAVNIVQMSFENVMLGMKALNRERTDKEH